MFEILNDIKNGALPLKEIPGFILWAIGKTFWFWFFLIFAAFVLIAR